MAPGLNVDHKRLTAALEKATAELLAERNAAGYWGGELSSSALSTATAVTALAIVDRESGSLMSSEQIYRGLQWLAEHANADGGWGDTVISKSNLSTTTLCRSAFAAARADQQFEEVVRRAGAWLGNAVGSSDVRALARAVVTRYGKDRTFSAPILTMCALSGRLGPGAAAWDEVIQLPFELAALPSRFYAILRLPVVSYALPALIAVGQVRHHHAPTGNAIIDGVRNWLRPRTLEILRSIQPENGGFLEATPLTSFVVMSLAGSGQVAHPVTRKSAEFLRKSQREDGSWPIDTNLATWVTTLSVNALTESLGAEDRERIRGWLLQQQYTREHRYTNAAPGGWAWTDLPGGVPDADDTCGALLALARLGDNERAKEAARRGLKWLIDLQNGDGGLPTFCRGWGALPFDRSSADITAHGIEAWLAWLDAVPAEMEQSLHSAIRSGAQFLLKHQQPSGAWAPLWFGNEHAPEEQNLTYGTARVVAALATLAAAQRGEWFEPYFERALNRMLTTGVRWLLRARQRDGGWGGTEAGPVSVEETSLALTALAAALRHVEERSVVEHAIARGTDWLIERLESAGWRTPAPIGFYFARLWYYEKLYPMIFATGALRAVNESFH